MLKQIKVLISKKRKTDECHTFIVNNDWTEMRHPTSHITGYMSVVECLMEHILRTLRRFLFRIHKQALVAGIHC